jgi:hypothetical protein
VIYQWTMMVSLRLPLHLDLIEQSYYSNNV